MVEMFLSKSQGRKDAHLNKCSRKYLMQTSEFVVHSATLYEAEAGQKRAVYVCITIKRLQMSKICLAYWKSPLISRLNPRAYSCSCSEQMMTHFNCNNTSRNRENNQDWNKNLRRARLDFKRRENDIVLF